MPALPSYVKIMFDGYQQSRDSAVLRTDMESGPPKQVRIKTRVMVTRQAKLFLNSKANFQAFETWFVNDLQGGALFFDMKDPVSGATVQARFTDGIYTARPMVASLTAWEVSCQLETWSA